MSGPRYVPQEHPYGCQIAVAAMLLGVDYSQALAAYDFSDPDYYKARGLTRTWLEMMLADRGFAIRVLWRSRGIRTDRAAPKKYREPWPPAPFTNLHWCEVEPSPGALGHCVLMLRDGSVLDPAAGPAPRSLADYHAVLSVTGVWPPGVLP